MKIHSAHYIKSALKLSDCPDWLHPEIAVVGRSNVGKSSLINSLLGRKNLARTSQTPGKTRLLNFYEINEAWGLVDLPGYGYAKVSKSEQQSWREHLERYLTDRPQLKLVLLLIDARIDAQDMDVMMAQWLGHHQIPTALVLTKTDKVKSATLHARQAHPLPGLDMTHVVDTIASSAKTNKGKEALLALVQRHLYDTEA